MINKRSYTRHLPDEVPEGFPIFLTWNLKRVMPQAAIEKLLKERERLEKQAPRFGELIAARKLREDKLIFAMGDRYIENNPVAAGLCQRREKWPWSSARFRMDWRPAEPYKKMEDRIGGREPQLGVVEGA